MGKHSRNWGLIRKMVPITSIRENLLLLKFLWPIMPVRRSSCSSLRMPIMVTALSSWTMSRSNAGMSWWIGNILSLKVSRVPSRLPAGTPLMWGQKVGQMTMAIIILVHLLLSVTIMVMSIWLCQNSLLRMTTMPPRWQNSLSGHIMIIHRMADGIPSCCWMAERLNFGV